MSDINKKYLNGEKCDVGIYKRIRKSVQIVHEAKIDYIFDYVTRWHA